MKPCDDCCSFFILLNWPGQGVWKQELFLQYSSLQTSVDTLPPLPAQGDLIFLSSPMTRQGTGMLVPPGTGCLGDTKVRRHKLLTAVLLSLWQSFSPAEWGYQCLRQCEVCGGFLNVPLLIGATKRHGKHIQSVRPSCWPCLVLSAGSILWWVKSFRSQLGLRISP